MRHDDHTTRYDLELEMIERRAACSDRHALELLHSEFQLALNASYFNALAVEDVVVGVRSRSTPQEDVVRYAVTLDLVERTRGLSDEGAAELLKREFRRALNASHFWRVCLDDIHVTFVARTDVDALVELRPGA